MPKQRKLVVIVDDDQAVRESLEFALRIEGFCVHVHSGAATLLQDPDLSRARCVVLERDDFRSGRTPRSNLLFVRVIQTYGDPAFGHHALDECMRQIDGFALLDTLQARNLSLPTIMLTSYATSRLLEKADRIGVRTVLEKPLLDNVLVDTIRGIIAGPSNVNT